MVLRTIFTSVEMTIITTPRLLLREATLDDAAFFHALMNTAEWIQYIGDRGIHQLEQARNYIQNSLLKHYATHGFGLWVVALRDGEAPIGICGVLKRAGLDDPDIGFAFLPEYAGQGYAAEAAFATLDYAWKTLKLRRVLAITTAENQRSIKLLERIGLHFASMVVLPGSMEEMALFTTGNRVSVENENAVAAIDFLVGRFYGAFCNKGGVEANVDVIAEIFIREGIIINNTNAIPSIQDIPSFIAPRRELLSNGRLIDFEEHELRGETKVVGKIAQRFSEYEKSGILDGGPFRQTGCKMMQFLLTPEGWRFTGVVWDDGPPVAG